MLKTYLQKRAVKKQLILIFHHKAIYNVDKYYPIIKDIELLQYGYKILLDLNYACSFNDFKKLDNYILTCFKAYEVEINNNHNNIELLIYTLPLQELPFKRVSLEPTQLLLGYNYKENIVVDMLKTPHLLISGLSGQGKTQMVKTIIKNLNNADVILINAFKGDFKGYTGRFITGEINVLKFLTDLLQAKYERSRPMYVVIDELLTLTKNKEISKCITDLLAIARHFNIFIIGIAQEGTKENLKFKQLFNARVCFRMIEDSSYKTVLGCIVQEQLNKQEFYLYSDGLYKGRTFNNNF